MSPIPWARILGVLALVVAAFGILAFAAQRLRSDLEGAGAAKVQAAQAKTDAREANRRASAVAEVAHDAQLQSDSSRAAAAAADRARDNERLQLAAYVRAHRGSADPAASGASAPADDPIGVLAEMLGSADDFAGRVAAEADANRIAGLACERSYDALTP
jgi:hypothetical protein